jgi:hypothetical protein
MQTYILAVKKWVSLGMQSVVNCFAKVLLLIFIERMFIINALLVSFIIIYEDISVIPVQFLQDK